MKKRLISFILAALMLLMLLPSGILSVSAAPAVLDVKWNVGGIGGNTNSTAKNKLYPAADNYRYSDIIIVEKAGTKISFTDSVSTGDSGSYFVSHTMYVFTTWKQSGSDWVIDLNGANICGTFQNKSLGQTPVTGGMKYEFVTDHDNQAIRISYRYSGADDIPVVTAEATTEKSTLAQLTEREFTATLDADGTVKGLLWFCGYASSASNTNGSAKEVRFSSAEYAVSNLFLVPKAGTKISYTFSQSGNSAFNAFTRYKLVDGRYVYDIGYESTNPIVMNGSTYSYVTSNDNEVLRISLRPRLAYTDIDVASSPVKVTWQQTNEPGTAGTVLETTWPDAELLSLVTAAPLIGKEVTGLTWSHGYIGSQYHDSAKYAIASPSNVDYYYSSVFTVPKAGTTVYFFDQTFTDFDGGKHASTSVLTVSHWKAVGSAWAFDKTKEYLTGCDVYNILLTDDYRCYAYTTTEDNENLRLCMRYAPVYSTEEALIPPVYLVEKTELAPLTSATGELTQVSYKDASGDTVGYGVFLPENYSADKQYTLIFDNSSDGAVAASLVKKNYKGIVVAYSGATDKSLRLLDAVIGSYPVKVSDLLLVGGDELAAHAKKYEHIRLCRAMLVTGSTLPAAEYASMKLYSDFASADEAAVWLAGETGDYYSPLEGIKMYAIGDSYFGGSGLGQHQTWVNLMGYKYGMTFHNYGIGGNTVAAASGQSGNQPPMATRYTELPEGGDVYFIEGGRNDRHYSVPFGNNDSTKINSFKGALNTIIKSVRAKNPDALIVLVTPWSSKLESGYLGTNDAYADAMQQLADYYNDPHIVCLYAADTEFTGIDMSKPACRTKYCLSASDYSHLNADGMYMVAPIFEKWLADKLAALRGLEVVNSAEGEQFNAVTTQPADTDSVGADTTASPTDPGESGKKGCGGSLISVGMLSLICAGAALTFKKKKH